MLDLPKQVWYPSRVTRSRRCQIGGDAVSSSRRRLQGSRCLIFTTTMSPDHRGGCWNGLRRGSDLENLSHSDVETGCVSSESKVSTEVELVVTTQEKS